MKPYFLLSLLIPLQLFFSGAKPAASPAAEDTFCDKLHTVVTDIEANDCAKHLLGYVRRDSSHHADVYTTLYHVSPSGEAHWFRYNEYSQTGLFGYEECVVDNITREEATTVFNDYFFKIKACTDGEDLKMSEGSTDGLSHASNEQAIDDAMGELTSVYLDIYESDTQPGKYGVWMSVNF